jgi:hypothetical protein
MTASELASNYVTLSAMVIVLGVSMWVVAWRDSTHLLPGNRRRNERRPRFLRWTLNVRRAGVWLIVFGSANLVLALILEGVAS